jgi:homoserine kinase
VLVLLFFPLPFTFTAQGGFSDESEMPAATSGICHAKQHSSKAHKATKPIDLYGWCVKMMVSDNTHLLDSIRCVAFVAISFGFTRILFHVSQTLTENQQLLSSTESEQSPPNMDLSSPDLLGPTNQQINGVIVRVPATTANMGSGFDTIGMALDLWSEFRVEKSNVFEVISTGEGASFAPLNESNLVCQAVKKVFEVAGVALPPLKYTLRNGIPIARGLGSSSAAIVGGLIAGAALTGYSLSENDRELVHIAATIEGHPDNVGPSWYGGIRIGIFANERWITQPVNLPPNMICVCFIPDAIGTTAAARAVLQEMVSRNDAVFNIGRVAWLVNCLATGNMKDLKFGVEDAIHQSQRAHAVYPYYDEIAAAATLGGANAVYLSGAGPTIISLVHCAAVDLVEKVGNLMDNKAKELGIEGKILVSKPSQRGAHITCVNP